MKKIITVLLCMLVCLSTLTIPVKANETNSRTATVPLTKDYKACRFEITMDVAGDYTGTVSNDSGALYVLQIVSETQLTCTASNVTKGDWYVTICSESEDPIPRFTVKAQTTDSEYDPHQTIKVGKDISNLALHFEDGNLVAEWDNDPALSSVKITVTKLDNNQVIDSSTVTNDNRYTCEIPSNTKKIYVAVVPSESVNIGVDRTFTLDVPERPSIVAFFCDDEYSVSDVSEVDFSVGGGKYTYSATCNDVEVIKENPAEIYSGDFSVFIPTFDDGPTSLKISLRDVEGNTWSFTKHLVKDTVMPRVTFNADYNGVTTNKESIDIEGRVYDCKQLSIGEHDVIPATDGYFSYSCSLHEGVNDIKVVAYDEAGNVANMSFAINLQSTAEKQKIDFVPIIIFVVAAIGVACLIIASKRKKKEQSSDSIQEAVKPETLAKEVNKSKEPVVAEPEYEDVEIEIEEEYSVESDEELDLSSTRIPETKRRMVTKTVKRKKVPAMSMDLSESVDRRITDKRISKDKLIGVAVFGILALLVWFTINYVVLIGYVPSESMMPYINAGDYYVGLRPLAWGNKVIERGDVIVFEKDIGDGKGTQTFMKRVIATEGENVAFLDGNVYINGEKLDESIYLSPEVFTACAKEFVVDDGALFVMGDNRKDSADSRYWVSETGPYAKAEDVIAIVYKVIPMGRSK